MKGLWLLTQYYLWWESFLPLLRPARFAVLCWSPCLAAHVPRDFWFAYQYAQCTVVRSSPALEQEWDPTGVFRGSTVLEQMYKLFMDLLSVGSLFEMVLSEKYSFSALSRRGCLLTILHAFCTLYRWASVSQLDHCSMTEWCLPLYIRKHLLFYKCTIWFLSAREQRAFKLHVNSSFLFVKGVLLLFLHFPVNHSEMLTFNLCGRSWWHPVCKALSWR